MPPVNVRNLKTGAVKSVPTEADARSLVAAQPLTWSVASEEDTAKSTAAAQVTRDYDTVIDKAAGGVAAGLRGISAGFSDPMLRGLGVEAADLKNQRAAIGDWATPIEVGAGIASAFASGGSSLLARTPAAAIARLGGALSRTAPEAGALARIGGAARGAAAEGALVEVGMISSDLALAESPEEVERIIGSMGSRVLTGAALSGGAGAALGGLESALVAGSRRLKAAKEAAPVNPGDIPDDIAQLDRAGVAAAQEAELARIEATRVPERAQLVADLENYREGTKNARPWDAVATGSKASLEEAAQTAKLATAAAVKAEKAAIKASKELGPTGPKLPGYADLGAKPVGRTIPARSLAGHTVALAGVGEDAVKMAAARKAIAEGQKKPINLVVRADGSYEVADGRARLVAAMEADAPIKVTVSKGAPGKSDGAVPIGAEHAALRSEGGRSEVQRLTDLAVTARADAVAAQQAFAEVDAMMKSATPRWMREHGKTFIEADKHIDRLLRNTEGLSEGTSKAAAKRSDFRSALQEQRQALDKIQARAADLHAIYATDRTGRRAASLAAVPDAIAANKALQARIEALSTAPMSDRLRQLDAHDKMLMAPTPEPSFASKMLGGVAFGAGSSAVSSIPLVGSMLAPFAGAGVAGLVTGRVGKGLVGARKAAMERTARAVDLFIAGTKVARKALPQLASRASTAILESTRFGPEQPPEDLPAGYPTQTKLEVAFNARARELASSIALTPMGPQIAPHARANIAAQFAPLAVTSPVIADRLETAAVNRLLYLYGKMPKRDQIGMTPLPPGEMAIRAWARYVGAAEDPGGIEERLANGTLTVEDAEVMRDLYPARMRSLLATVSEKIGADRLGYTQRLNLSLLTGQPLDASLMPTILSALQAGFLMEPGTEGGQQAPRPSPQFGSVKKPEPTRAQRRAG